MRNAFFIVICVLTLIVCVDLARATTNVNCIIVDVRNNVVAWENRTQMNVAYYRDLGEHIAYYRNQIRANSSIPNRVHDVVVNWHIRSQSLRYRMCKQRQISRMRIAIAICTRRIDNGDAYTRELYDVCIAKEY